MNDSSKKRKTQPKSLDLLSAEDQAAVEPRSREVSYDENFEYWIQARAEEYLAAAHAPESLEDAGVAVEGEPRVLVFHGIDDTGDKDVSRRLEPFAQLVGQYLPMAKTSTMEDELIKLQVASPWLEDAIRSLRRSIWLSLNRSGSAGFKLRRPLLLVGEPGIGKSWFAQMIPEMLGIPFFTISAGGKADNMALKGAARGWSSARPSEVVQFVAQQKIANVFVVIDEIDKVGTSSHNGNFADTLLALFEPENARHWRDEFLLGRVDLSNVNWVCTANSLESISEPLRSRMDIVRLSSPSKASEARTMINQVARRIAHEYGITEAPGEVGGMSSPWPDFISDEEVIGKLVRGIRTPRAARKVLEGLLDLWLTHQVSQRCN